MGKITKLEMQFLKEWGYGSVSYITLNNARKAAKIAIKLAREAYLQAKLDSQSGWGG